MIKLSKKILISSLIWILASSLVISYIPNAYAKDLTIESECNNGVWTATILDEQGNPLTNVEIRTIPTITSTDIEKKFETGENGMVSIIPEDDLGFVWVSKGGYNDKKLPTGCEQKIDASMNGCIGGFDSVAKLEVGDNICTVGKTRLSSLDKVEVEFHVCISESPEYAQASFDISTSLETITVTERWEESLDLVFSDIWCIQSEIYNLKIPPYTETYQINEDLRTSYGGPAGINLKSMKEEQTVKGEELMKQKLAQERSVSILSIHPHDQLVNRYYVDLEVCASGTEGLTDPFIIVRSDTEEIQSNIYAIMAPLTCKQYTTKAMSAVDPRSFVADFAEKFSGVAMTSDLEQRIIQLEQENLELRVQLEKKDAVLMEQIKVIQDLANMVSKTIFESISRIFQF